MSLAIQCILIIQALTLFTCLIILLLAMYFGTTIKFKIFVLIHILTLVCTLLIVYCVYPLLTYLLP